MVALRRFRSNAAHSNSGMGTDGNVVLVFAVQRGAIFYARIQLTKALKFLQLYADADSIGVKGYRAVSKCRAVMHYHRKHLRFAQQQLHANSLRTLQIRDDNETAQSHYMAVSVFRSAMHDMAGHDRRHVQALSLQLRKNLSLSPDDFKCVGSIPLFPLPPTDHIHLRLAFSALQMTLYRVTSDGGSRVSALVVSSDGVWMRCSVVSGLLEAAHGWVAVTGGDDLVQAFLPGMDPAKPFFFMCPQYIRPYSALLDG